MTRTAVWRWRRGKTISVGHITALVELTGSDPTLAVKVLEERASDKPQRRVMRAVRKLTR